MDRVSLLALGLLLVTAGCVSGPLAGDGESPDSRNATVITVVDGDTVDVVFPDGTQDRVRLLGVDTPEVHVEPEPVEYEGVPDTEAGERCLRDAGSAASSIMEHRIAGRDVRLVFDPIADRRGGYDRLLAYVYQNDTNLNYWLVENGHARVYDTEFTEAERFYAAEVDAQQANRGLWNCTSGS